MALWHRNYGEVLEDRVRAVNLARAEGAKVASKVFRVHPNTIRRWIRRMEDRG